MNKIALLYAPKGGSVEKAAKKLEKVCQHDIDVIEIAGFDVRNLMNYENFILGCSTVGAENWEDAEADNEWDALFHNIEEKKISLKDKIVAIFGLGNQVLYPDHFVDAMMYLKNECKAAGAKVIGEWPTDGYDFTDSESIEGDHFVGLPLDEDNEPNKTEERIRPWLEKITNEMK